MMSSQLIASTNSYIWEMKWSFALTHPGVMGQIAV